MNNDASIHLLLICNSSHQVLDKDNLRSGRTVNVSVNLEREDEVTGESREEIQDNGLMALEI